jgi:rare lipoprotein A (peptidoglycan hydrolase)
MKRYIHLILGIFIYTVVSAQTDISVGVRENPMPVSAQDTSILKKDSAKGLLIQDTTDRNVTPDSLKIDSADAPVYKTITGIASFYSSNLHGSKTSTGETYRHEKNTAASNNFKLNTIVRVTNLENNKSVIVRINDHMHKKMAKKGRVVDLSRSAAKKLDFMKQGLTRVKVEEVPPGTEE